MQSRLTKIFTRFTALFLLVAFATFLPEGICAADKKKKFVVVIDAGHGGKDTGAIENNVKEKDVNLAVALKLGNLISKKLKDTEVIYTRDNDTFISLQKRSDIANAAKGDLFISIHCNSVDKSNKNRANVVGATTYVLGHHKDKDNLAVAQRENSVAELDADDKLHFEQYDRDSDESHIIFEMTQRKNFQNSIRFAKDVQDEMSRNGRHSRGVQQAGFWVLWSTAMPAALIELDFICNPEQAKFLGSNEGQEKLAAAIFNAVKNYESYYRRNLEAARGGERTSIASKMASRKNNPSEATAKEDPVEELLTRQEEEIVNEEAAVVAAVELPVETSVETPRSHRKVSAPVSSSKSSGSHRRRSAASRVQGSSNVEEALIAVFESSPSEQIAVVTSESSSENPAKESPSRQRKSVKEEKKKDTVLAANSRPARRDKEGGTKRRAVRQNINVVYKVLLFTSERDLSANDTAFKGLKPVASYRESNEYKYTYGESADRETMEAARAEISELFPQARVIKCYN